MSKIKITMTTEYEVSKNTCPQAIFDEISKLNEINTNDIGFEHKITNKTADWLAEHTKDLNQNGFFIKYEFFKI